MTDKKRVNVFLAPEVYDRLVRVSKSLGRSYTGIASLSIKLGLDLLELSTSKEFQNLLEKDPETVEKLGRMVDDAQNNKTD